MTEGIISQVEALGWAQKQPTIVVPDVDVNAVEDGSVAPAQPLFLPLDLDAIVDVEVDPVLPLRVHQDDVEAENTQGVTDQGAAGQGVLAPADEKIESVAYKVVESDNEDDDLPVLRHYESDDDS